VQLHINAAIAALPPVPITQDLPASMANAVFDPITGASIKYRGLIKRPDATLWLQGNTNEIGQITDGRVGNKPGTGTMFFIRASAMPKGRKATYLRVVASYQPQKEDPYRIRWTAGGNKIDYPGVVSTPTADLTTVKIHLNSTISTDTAKYLCADIKDFYLATKMDRYEYMWVPVHMLPDAVMTAYNLPDLVVNNRVLVEIRKEMYGLP
jgi:hypothetical protein